MGRLRRASSAQPSSKRLSRDEWRALFVAEKGQEPIYDTAFLQWVDKKVKAGHDPTLAAQLYSLLTGPVRQVDPLMSRVKVKDLGAAMAVFGVLALVGEPAREAVVRAIEEIDERLAMFPQIKLAVIERRAARTGKKAGRRSLEEYYWLAREIADILSNVPGVEVKSSKAGPTLFSRVLKLCAECVGHNKSVERIATAAAKQVKPVAVEEEAWKAYLDSTSKALKSDVTPVTLKSELTLVTRTIRKLTKPRRR